MISRSLLHLATTLWYLTAALPARLRVARSALLAIALACVLAAPASGDLASDLQLMKKLLTGEFDNFQQVWEERESKAPYPHEHIHSVFVPVALPAFGAHVFYVRQYLDGDPAKVRRQHLYCFFPNQEENAIQLKIYAFADDTPYIDALLNPRNLEGLTPDKMRYLPGCEVHWKREGEGFAGTMKEMACRIESKPPGKTLVVSSRWLLNRDEFWIGDQAKEEQGNQISGYGTGTPQKLKRCRFFTGWAAVQREGTQDFDLSRDLLLHDQGNRATIKSGEKEFEVELAQLIYQNTRTAILKIAIYEKGKAQSVAYAWANPEADRIGINLRWIQAGFTLRKSAQGGVQ